MLSPFAGYSKKPQSFCVAFWRGDNYLFYALLQRPQKLASLSTLLNRGLFGALLQHQRGICVWKHEANLWSCRNLALIGQGTMNISMKIYEKENVPYNRCYCARSQDVGTDQGLEVDLTRRQQALIPAKYSVCCMPFILNLTPGINCINLGIPLK